MAYAYITPKGYRRILHLGRLRMEHVVVWEATQGQIPPGMQVHHRNEDKLDNCIENLELVTALHHKRLHSGCKLVDGVWWKKCRHCEQFKPIDADHWYFVATRGGHVMSVCKDCQIANSVAFKQRRRARHVALTPAVGLGALE